MTVQPSIMLNESIIANLGSDAVEGLAEGHQASTTSFLPALELNSSLLCSPSH